MLEIIFWLAAGLVVYPYLVYPLMLIPLSRMAGHQAATGVRLERMPSVTVVVSAHNEASVIEAKIRTTLECDYPSDLLTVTVVSDASTDDTNALVAAIAEQNSNVRLVALDEHRGKTAGLNVAMNEIESDIVVFTDANAIFDPGAIRNMIECMADPNVGYVVGAALYEKREDKGAGRSEGLYWRYELAIKERESQFESVVGGDGAIYAVRRKLYRTLAPEDINDFVNPLQVIAQGYRGIFCAEARAYEDTANDYLKEFRRKRRIVCRSWGALLRYAGDLNLMAHPRFLFMLLSHKVIRWFTMLWVTIAVVSNSFLIVSDSGPIYIVTIGAIIASFGLAGVGWRLAARGPEMSSIVSIPYYFYLSNIAALRGIIDYACGNRYVTWEHARLT